MSRLNINGTVLYSDTTPAGRAQIRIIEVDALPGGSNDRILDVVADLDGHFSGRSSEWKDREGTVPFTNIPIPDVLNLQFEVRVDGQTHRGPFLLNQSTSQSVPIVLPFGPQKPVSKADRELVQIIIVSQDYTGAEKALYQSIEVASEGLTRDVLGDKYRRLTFLKGSSATLANFAAALQTAASGSTEAVDVIFTTHGRSEAMVFADAQRSEETVRTTLLTMPAATRAKLRSIFSTACFGATHLDTWIAVGFTDASGAEGIYADSETSYLPFLNKWGSEGTFAEAVDAANNAQHLGDGIARAFYLARSQPDRANAVNSHRVRAGTGHSRLYTRP